MAAFLFKHNDSEEHRIRYKLIIIDTLIFALPFLIVAYILYHGNYSLSLSHIILLAIVISLILTGMIIVRHILKIISAVASGDFTSVDLKKDDEKNPLLIEDIEKDPRTLKSNNPGYGPPSFLCMPVFAGCLLPEGGSFKGYSKLREI